MVSTGGHLLFSASLGAAYGYLGYHQLQFEFGTAILAGCICAIGGLLPDLDRNSSGPAGEIFCVFAAALTILMLHRYEGLNLSGEERVLAVVMAFIVIRYGIGALIKRICISQGMFHSIPAALIAGLIIYLGYKNPEPKPRIFVSLAMVLGFMSHLVLDQFGTAKDPRSPAKAVSGQAMKLWSSSKRATAACYSLLASLGFLSNWDFKNDKVFQDKLKEKAGELAGKVKEEIQNQIGLPGGAGGAGGAANGNGTVLPVSRSRDRERGEPDNNRREYPRSQDQSDYRDSDAPIQRLPRNDRSNDRGNERGNDRGNDRPNNRW